MYKKIIFAIISRLDYIDSLYNILLKHYHEYDECYLCINTNKDIDIYKNKFTTNNKVKLKIETFDELQPNPLMNLNTFYKNYAIDEKSVYIKIDDDMLWFEDNFFTKLFNYRIQNKDNFLIYPLIINNAILTNILIRFGKFEWDNKCWYQPMDPIGWGSGLFAKELHDKFLDIIKLKTYNNLKFDKWVLDWRELVNINVISFFGSDMKLVAPTLNFHTDEAYFCHYGPSLLNKQNIIYGQFICSHYAFQPQKQYLDTTDIKQKYLNLYQ
jgi:hypothetical protein